MTNKERGRQENILYFIKFSVQSYIFDWNANISKKSHLWPSVQINWSIFMTQRKFFNRYFDREKANKKSLVTEWLGEWVTNTKKYSLSAQETCTIASCKRFFLNNKMVIHQ